MNIKMMEKTIQDLTRKVSILRSFMINIVNDKDDEGEYKTSFVKSVLKASKEKAILEYSGRGSLLKQIKSL